MVKMALLEQLDHKDLRVRLVRLVLMDIHL